MDETIRELIERSGANWEAVRDRTNSPVLLTKDIRKGCPLWELSLEQGARHPYWTVIERTMTDEEWDDLGRDSMKGRIQHVGVIFPISSSAEKHGRVCAYIKNGRKPAESGWSYCLEPVKVTVEKIIKDLEV